MSPSEFLAELVLLNPFHAVALLRAPYSTQREAARDAALAIGLSDDEPDTAIAIEAGAEMLARLSWLYAWPGRAQCRVAH